MTPLPNSAFYASATWTIERLTELLRIMGSSYILFMVVWIFILKLIVSVLITVKEKK